MHRLNRSQRVLIAAFAISLILHFVFAIFYTVPRPRRSSDVETVTILRRSMAIVVRTPQPPPPATPKPHPRPQPSAPKATPAAQGFAPGNGGGAQKPVPTPVPTPVATLAAAPTPKPCGGNDIKAAVSEMPPQPDVPNAARTQGAGGIAAVDVKLDEHGEVTAAAVARSTGNSQLDLVAVSTARQARYTPALHDCHAVPGDYTFTIKFFAW
jgi:TonB family protein